MARERIRELLLQYEEPRLRLAGGRLEVRDRAVGATLLHLVDPRLVGALNRQQVGIARRVHVHRDEGELRQLRGGLRADVLADLPVELGPRLPWTVLRELAHHPPAGAWNEQDLRRRGRVQVDVDERLL